ncbi:hypothetical protein Bhyg_06796 [Pseudolycoriella hygida]|uniref:Uncharacterized protein n=1 Tax=Pseudolycoriella hygida TaxID=35572 RepID=A0A9Q0N205_9DIPT|nr:hypothetical protein Bhyg_06796 [Pseudolycoriella hygida]
MYNKTLVFCVGLLFGIAAAANDQQYWIEQAERNAMRNIDQWPRIVEEWSSGKNLNPMRDEIQFFRTQIGDSIKNMNSFVPKLISVVEYINSTAAASPNFYRRGVLHTILWYIRGKRDNESYYLLDGAENWVKQRLSELTYGGGRAVELGQTLDDASGRVARLRDELDSLAQKYVLNIGKIDDLSSNICDNIEEIRVLANELVNAFGKSQLLKNADDLNNFVGAIKV